MIERCSRLFRCFSVLGILLLVACGQPLPAATLPPTSTPVPKLAPTNTATPPPPTATPLPTATPTLTPTPTATPVPPTATPAFAPPPETAMPWLSWDGYEITWVESGEESNESDLWVVDERTGETVFAATLLDLYRMHYHNAEYHDGHLYVIRRIGYEGDDDADWTDELWRYDAEGEGTQIYSVQGLDFRVAPGEEYIAVGYDLENLHLLDGAGEVVHEFHVDQLSAADAADSPMPPFLALDRWTSDGTAFWGSLSAGPSPQGYFRVQVPDGHVDAYDISALPIHSEVTLNADEGLIAYSDYPAFFDVDSQKAFEASGESVILYLHSLEGGHMGEIATSEGKAFQPLWVDEVTLEYNDPETGERIIYTLSGSG